MALTQVDNVVTNANLNVHITDNVVYMRPYLSLLYQTTPSAAYDHPGAISYRGWKIGKTFNSTIYATGTGGGAYGGDPYFAERLSEIVSQLPAIGKKYYLTPDIQPIAENNNRDGVRFILPYDDLNNDLSSVVIDNNQIIANQEIQPAVDMGISSDGNGNFTITSITPLQIPQSTFIVNNPAGFIGFRAQAYQQRPVRYRAYLTHGGGAGLEYGYIPSGQGNVIVAIQVNAGNISFLRVREYSTPDYFKVYLSPYTVNLTLDSQLPLS